MWGSISVGPTHGRDGSEKGKTCIVITNDGQLFSGTLTEKKYEDLLPCITAALSEFSGHIWSFELSTVDIPRNTEANRCSAQYVADTEDDGGMGYFADVLDWALKESAASIEQTFVRCTPVSCRLCTRAIRPWTPPDRMVEKATSYLTFLKETEVAQQCPLMRSGSEGELIKTIIHSD